MQVIDITLAEQPSTRITSLRVVQQKHCGSKYKLSIIITNQSVLRMKCSTREHLKCLVITQQKEKDANKHSKNSTDYFYTTTAWFLDSILNY
jgi:hypothetical protein